MKRIIMLLSLSLALLVSSQDAQASKPHKKHKAHVATVTRANIVKPTPRPRDEASVLAMMIDSSCDGQCMISATGAAMTTGTAYMCPSIDSGSCNLSPLFLSLMSTSQIPDGSPRMIDMNQSIMTANTALLTDSGSINNYYYAKAVYEAPTTVTIGGFSTPVTGNPLYFSPFKHRHGAPMPIHNTKGVDETAGVGVSPRANGFPESIGTWPAYTNTPPSR